MSVNTWFARIEFLLAGCVILGGCSNSGPPPAKLTGTVTLNGRPVTGGTMKFFSPTSKLKEQPSFQCMIRPDGTYTAAGVPHGKLKVTVSTESVRTTAEAREKMRAGGENRRQDSRTVGTAGSVGTYMEIPAKYANPKQTDLVVEIIGGEQEWNPVLKD